MHPSCYLSLNSSYSKIYATHFYTSNLHYKIIREEKKRGGGEDLFLLKNFENEAFIFQNNSTKLYTLTINGIPLIEIRQN